MFSEKTKCLREIMLNDAQNPTEAESIRNAIAYLLSAVKELDRRLEKMENKD